MARTDNPKRPDLPWRIDDEGLIQPGSLMWRVGQSDQARVDFEPDPSQGARVVKGLAFDAMAPPMPPDDLGDTWRAHVPWVLRIANAKDAARGWDEARRFASGHQDARNQAQAARDAYAAVRAEVMVEMKAEACRTGTAELTKRHRARLHDARALWLDWDDVTLLSESPSYMWDKDWPMSDRDLDAILAAMSLTEYLRVAAVEYVIAAHRRARKAADMDDPWRGIQVARAGHPWRVKYHGDEMKRYRAEGNQPWVDRLTHYRSSRPLVEGHIEAYVLGDLEPRITADYAERMSSARRGRN